MHFFFQTDVVMRGDDGRYWYLVHDSSFHFCSVDTFEFIVWALFFFPREEAKKGGGRENFEKLLSEEFSFIFLCIFAFLESQNCLSVHAHRFFIGE